MKTILSAAAILLAALVALLPAPAAAQSCYDLWYERNAIYARNGYCFQTSLGQRVFGNAGCYTSNPRLARWEQQRVAEIQRLERRYGCRVNK
ncbi:MAG: YARHG domain-containing protein [Notoacmeibacter sp.]|nr:YARHG domain-containing protein [Notoacmeibacter sp.]